jgi:hypothetical protein
MGVRMRLGYDNRQPEPKKFFFPPKEKRENKKKRHFSSVTR